MRSNNTLKLEWYVGVKNYWKQKCNDSFMNCIGMALVNKSIQVSSTHFYDTWSVHCIKCVPINPSQFFLHHHIVDSFSSFTTPHPIPSDNRHTVVCAYEFLFVHLLLSVVYPTQEGNHMLLNFFSLPYFIEHDILKIHPPPTVSQMTVFFQMILKIHPIFLNSKFILKGRWYIFILNIK